MTSVPSPGSELILTLPAGWRPLPAASGRDGTLVAVHGEPTASGFLPNLSVCVLPDAPTHGVSRAGSVALRRLEEAGHDVSVRRREALGSGRTEGLAQELRFRVPVGGADVEVAQLLLVLVLGAGTASSRVAACVATLTAAVDDVVARAADLERMLATIPVSPGGAH